MRPSEALSQRIPLVGLIRPSAVAEWAAAQTSRCRDVARPPDTGKHQRAPGVRELSASRIRATLFRLGHDGLMLGRSRSPADCWITRTGRAVITLPTYREYRTRRDLPSGAIK